MLEWLYAAGMLFLCIAAFLDARTRNLDRHLKAQEREKAAPKYRRNQ